MYINSNFCHVKNLNKTVYLNPKFFGAKLKAEENLFTLTPKRFWTSLKLKWYLCTLTLIFCHVKNLNKLFTLTLKFLGTCLKLGKICLPQRQNVFGQVLNLNAICLLQLQFFCHVKNLNKIVYLNRKFLRARLKAKGKFCTLILFLSREKI